MSTRILLVDDHQIVRKGMRALLGHEPGMTVVGEAGTGREAVALAKDLRPDVVLMDISLPELNGVDATRLVVEACPGVRVVAMTAHALRTMISAIFQAGASGYLIKDSAVEELAQAIHTVMAGNVYVSPRVAGTVIGGLVGGGGGLTGFGSDHPGGGPAAVGVFGRLTNRERQVLQLMAEGNATKEVARALSVSVKTAETHRRSIMQKLELFSVAELTKFAIREGLTSVE